METIDDIRRDRAIPGMERWGGPPRSINRFFGELSALKFVAAGFFIVGIALSALGVFTLVFPIAIVGFVALAAAAFVYARARSRPIL